MQRLISIIGFILFPLYMNGQSFTMSDHYVHEALAINPAYAGSQDALSMTILYRNFNSGFEGSPKTMSLSIHTPVSNEKIGLGLFIMNDKIGVSEETNFVGNYAYRMDLGYGKLAFGLGLCLTLNKTEWNKLAALDANDEQLANTSSSGLMPNFSAGIYYSTKNYFIGLSVPLLLSHVFNPLKDKYITKNDFSNYNYFCNAGYILDAGSNLKIYPSFLLKYHKGDATQIDINSKIILKNRVGFGATYRSNNVIIGRIECQLNNQLRIGYSYDFKVGGDLLYKYNSHEIMLNYIFNYKTEVAGPRQF
jgi:type IX secretion system PorP/SprF family membrane protein